MTKPKKKRTKPNRKVSPEHRASPERLAAEAQAWQQGAPLGDGWQQAPEAVVRHKASTTVTMRMPIDMLAVLKGFAERKGIGYQALVKQWLDERIRVEGDKLLGKRTVCAVPAGARYAPPVDGLVDRADIDGPHYEHGKVA